MYVKLIKIKKLLQADDKNYQFATAPKITKKYPNLLPSNCHMMCQENLQH